MRSFILLFLVLCFGSLQEAFCGLKQSVSFPESNSDIFTEPAINVHATISSSFVTLHDGECRYIFPTTARASSAWCNRSCFKDLRDVCKDYQSTLSIEYNRECLCARQVTVCNEGFAISGMSLGCVSFPPLPMPPTLLDTLLQRSEVNVVPARSSSYMHPQLRVVVSIGSGKRIYNIDYPDPMNYDVQREVISSDSGAGESLIVEKRLTKNKVCAKVMSFASSDAGVEDRKEYCFERYGSIDYSDLQICESGSGLCLGDREVPSFRPFILTASDLGKCSGPLCRRGFFLPGYLCVEKKSEDLPWEKTESVCGGGKFTLGGDGDVHCINGRSAACSPGYLVKMRYVHDPGGNMLCIKDVISFPEDYLTVLNGRVVLFSKNKKKFIPYKTKDHVDIPSTENVLDIPYTDQKILDNLKIRGGSKGFYELVQGARVLSYRYEGEELYCLNADLDEHGGCKKPFRSIENLPRGIAYVSAYFTDFEGKAFFFPSDKGEDMYSQNQCGGGLCYAPASSLHKGLCLFEQGSRLRYNYKATIAPRINGDSLSDRVVRDYMAMPLTTVENPIGSRFGSSECEIVEIQAFGGGSVGHGKNSGNSGEYTAGSMTLGDLSEIVTSDKVLLPVVGLGGGQLTGEVDGGDTILYVCNRLKEGCLASESFSNFEGCGYISDRKLYDDIIGFNNPKEDSILRAGVSRLIGGAFGLSGATPPKEDSILRAGVSRLIGGAFGFSGATPFEEDSIFRAVASRFIGGSFGFSGTTSSLQSLSKRRADLVRHNTEYIHQHCKVVVAARGGRVINLPDEDFIRFGREFEDKFMYKMHGPSLPGRENRDESECASSVPHYDLRTLQPFYIVPERGTCSSYGDADLSEESVLDQMFSKTRTTESEVKEKYGKGGCPGKYCSTTLGKVLHGVTSETERYGNAGILRLSCQKLKRSQ